MLAALSFLGASAQTETEAPENDVDLNEWTYLGEGSYADGLLIQSISYGATQPYSYNVPVYQNKADENKYLFYDIFPTSYLEYSYFTQTDDKPSQAIFTIDGSTVTAEYEVYLTFYYSSPVEFKVNGTGTHKDGVFSFPENAVSANLMGEDMASLAFTASLSAGNEGGEEGGEQDINLDDWTLLGEAEYTDGILHQSYGSVDKVLDPYQVLAYRNKKNGNQFLLANVFPENIIKNISQWIDFGLLDGKESNLILTVDPTTKQVTAEYKCTVVEYWEGEVDSDMTIDQRSNGQGTFENGTITFAPKAFVIEFENGYHDSGAITIKLPEGTELVEENANAASLTITVKNEEGEAIEGAWITFLAAEYHTNENGQAVIENIATDEVSGKEVDFSVFKDGYVFYEGKADFTNGLNATAEVTLEVEKITLTISVVDEEYEPIADATVEFMGKTYTTDAQGKVVIEGILGNEVMGKALVLTVSKTGYETNSNDEFYIEEIPASAMVTLKKDSTTSISIIASDSVNADAKVYDLNGRRVAAPAAGNVYIVNGVKVLVK